MAASKTSASEKEILRKLADLGGRQHDDDDITYGDSLVIPRTMTPLQASKFLKTKAEEMERATHFQRTFNYRPWDGAFCMWNAFKKTFGVVGHKGTPGFFGPSPPSMISVPSDVNEQTQVPWGQFTLPGLKDTFFETFDFHHEEMGPLFGISATGPKKYANEIEGVFKLVEIELRDHSMYRGKAFDGQNMPEFLDLSGIDRASVIYSEDVMTQLEVNLWAQLRHTAECERAGVPLKRAVLMHGQYGTGKTLAAFLTAKEATDNGWTFIQGRPGRDNLAFVMQTARLYQPSVVFYEDIDQVADVENLDNSGLSRLLDDFDGINAKGTKMLVVLTTNHPKRINKGMARPGRLDAMIEIKDLDLDGMTRLVKVVVGESKLADDIDWEAVYEAATGYMPAFVSEFASRATRYALVRNGGTIEGTTKLTTADLVDAANGLRPQFELMTDAKDKAAKPYLATALREEVQTAVRETVHPKVLIPAGGNGDH